MIIRTDFFPSPILFLGFTFTPRELDAHELRVSRIYAQQWSELFWVGYPLVWFFNFFWVFLLTLDDKKAMRLDPFEIERWYASVKDGDRKRFGWLKFMP